MSTSSLEYYVPISNVMFVQSNVTGPANTSNAIKGSLSVGVNSDPADTQATVKVAMSYSGADIRERTSVCLMNLAGSDGLYIYVSPIICLHSSQTLPKPRRCRRNYTHPIT